jgi:hypothetical protein
VSRLTSGFARVYVGSERLGFLDGGIQFRFKTPVPFFPLPVAGFSGHPSGHRQDLIQLLDGSAYA